MIGLWLDYNIPSSSLYANSVFTREMASPVSMQLEMKKDKGWLIQTENNPTGELVDDLNIYRKKISYPTKQP